MPFVYYCFCYGVALLATASYQSAAPGRIDNFAFEPRSDYDSRQAALVSSVAASTRSSLDVQIARLALNQGVLEEAVIRRSLAKINKRDDTADFDAVVLLRLYSYDGPGLTATLRKDIRATLLGFKYWVDEPGIDLLSMWSENHQIGYHTAEYLAGQFFPSEIFSNNGKSGAWHREAARARILRWIDIKAKTGFAEWDSNSYYPVTMGALLNLAELAADKEISDRAAMLLDVMFFDMAVDSFRGSYGTAHGRTYTGTVLGGGRGEGTSSLQYLAWGLGAPGGGDAALALATSKRYRVARTVEAIGDDLPAELVNRERQSLLIEDAAKFGLSYSNPNHFWLLNEGGKFRTIENIEAGYRVTDLWRDTLHRYGVVIKPYGDAVLATYRELAAQGKSLPDLDRTSLQRVDKITYRTPDYQLSTAQDYRKGAPGYQQHIWQATVGPDTPVFTFNPGPTHKYWQGRFPRNGQYKNVLVAIYNVPSDQPPGPKTIFPADASGNAMPSPSPSEDTLVARTLAVFHRTGFDEVVQKKNWTFARKDHAYLALWSKASTTWSQKEVLGGEGLVAEGRQNIWLCQLGREAIDGTFASWMEQIAKATIKVDGLSITYGAPGIGVISFGWDGPLRVNGRDEPLADYGRFDNPYCVLPYGSSRYEIAHAGHHLVLDFKTGERRETHSSQ